MHLRSMLAALSLVGLVLRAADAQGPILPAKLLPSIANGDGIAATDLNGDGAVDLVVDGAYGVNKIGVILGTGQGAFAAPSTLTVPGEATTPALGDLDSDGKLDLAYVDIATSRLYWLFGNGAGGFGTPNPLVLPNSPKVLALADFNLDGKLDALAPDVSHPNVLLGNGAGGFAPPIQSPFAVGGISRIQVGDVDGDGKPDAVSLSDTFNMLTLGAHRGVGDGTFLAPTLASVGVSPLELATGELDGDGLLDVAVVGNTMPGDYSSTTLSVLLATGGGAYSSPSLTLLPQNPRDVAFADLDRDQRLDVLVLDNFPGVLWRLKGLGNGAFGAPEASSFPDDARGFCIADLDGDGFLDAAATCASTLVGTRRGDGTGKLFAGRDVTLTHAPRSLAAADLTSDGTLDLAVADVGGVASLYAGDGSGGFAAGSALAIPGGSAGAVAAGDLNGDGALDLVAGATNGVQLLFGDGAGGLAFGPFKTVGGDPRQILVRDVNLDGRPDVVAFHSHSGSLDTLLGDGAGGVANAISSPISNCCGFSIRGDSIGDATNDGKPDVLFGFGSYVDVYAGDGNGSFAYDNGYDLGPGNSACRARLGDLDGDGVADAIAGSDWNGVGRVLGKASGGFATPGVFTPIGSGLPIGETAATDLNGDGKLDVVVACTGMSSLAVLLGHGSGGLAVEGLYLAGKPVDDLVVGDFNYDGRADVLSAAANDPVLTLHLAPPPPSTGAATYGTGTPGCFGSIALSANLVPHAGATAFGFVATNAPPSSLGLCIVADASSAAGVDPFGLGFKLHVDLFASTLLFGFDMHVDAGGTAFTPTPIPPGPAVVGLALFAQGLYVESPSNGASCALGSFHVLTSKGLGIVVQP